MQINNKSFSIALAIMLARTSTSFVSAFSHHASAATRRSMVPATASTFVNWQSQHGVGVGVASSTRRWMSEGSAPPTGEKTEEEKAAIKAVREARK